MNVKSIDIPETGLTFSDYLSFAAWLKSAMSDSMVQILEEMIAELNRGKKVWRQRFSVVRSAFPSLVFSDGLMRESGAFFIQGERIVDLERMSLYCQFRITTDYRLMSTQCNEVATDIHQLPVDQKTARGGLVVYSQAMKRVPDILLAGWSKAYLDPVDMKKWIEYYGLTGAVDAFNEHLLHIRSFVKHSSNARLWFQLTRIDSPDYFKPDGCIEVVIVQPGTGVPQYKWANRKIKHFYFLTKLDNPDKHPDHNFLERLVLIRDDEIRHRDQ